MGKQIDLLENYPKPKRDLNKRLSEKTSYIVRFFFIIKQKLSCLFQEREVH